MKSSRQRIKSIAKFIKTFIASSILIWGSYKLSFILDDNFSSLKWLQQILPLLISVIVYYIIFYIVKIDNKFIKTISIIYLLFTSVERLIFLVYPNCLPEERAKLLSTILIILLSIFIIISCIPIFKEFKKNTRLKILIITLLHFGNYFEHKLNIMLLYERLYNYIFP